MYFEVNQNSVFCSNGSGTIRQDQQSVIFIHGAGLDHSGWVLPARYFARKGFNVYALDLPGHGRSSGQALLSVSAMADWLLDLIQVLKLSRPALVGHSMGSLIALDFAARYPQILRSLALLGTSIPMPVSAGLLDAAKDNHHDAIDMANTWSHSNLTQLGGCGSPGINLLMAGQRLLENTQENVFYADLNACNQFQVKLEHCNKIDTDSLVLIGDQDKMTAASAALKVANAIPNSRIVRLGSCGHAMLAEQPNAVLDALITIV